MTIRLTTTTESTQKCEVCGTPIEPEGELPDWVPEKFEVLILAAAHLTQEHQTFTVEQLTVMCWELRPQKYGMTGFEKMYPSDKKVSVLLFGKQGMLQRGFLERAGAGLYRFPEKLPHQVEATP